MSLAVVTVTAGLVSTVPSTTTRPSAIQRSASRREHSPARAITFAIRSGAIRSGAIRAGWPAAACDILEETMVLNHDIGRDGAHGNSAMARALAEAAAAGAAGEVPVGAVLVDGGGAVVAAAGNRVERDHDPTAH